MNKALARRGSSGGGMVGLLLIAVGLLFLLGPLWGSAFAVWPLYIVALGMGLFYMVKRWRSFRLFTIPATMVTTLGMLLVYQTLTGHWGSWAYAWSLIFPTAFGLGTAVYGELTRKPSVQQAGEGLAKVGVGLFLVGAFFFEVVLGIGGLLGGFLSTAFLPVLLIASGIYLLARKRRRRGRSIYLTGKAPRALSDRPSHLEVPFYQEERERV